MASARRRGPRSQLSTREDVGNDKPGGVGPGQAATCDSIEPDMDRAGCERRRHRSRPSGGEASTPCTLHPHSDLLKPPESRARDPSASPASEASDRERVFRILKVMLMAMPFTLHPNPTPAPKAPPTPYTLHPTPYARAEGASPHTLHPSPFTIRPSPRADAAYPCIVRKRSKRSHCSVHAANSPSMVSRSLACSRVSASTSSWGTSRPTALPGFAMTLRLARCPAPFARPAFQRDRSPC